MTTAMEKSKEILNDKKIQLISLTKGFSEEYLNEEYEVVIEKLINKMARKRTVPFMSGKIEIWAAAVIHALGSINFLFDKENQPYATVHDICDYFGTNQSTTTQKSKIIRDMFKLTYFDSEFATESVNCIPFQNFYMINGKIVHRRK